MQREKKTMDGNEAAAYVSYAYSEVAAIYPITPSSPMPEHIDEWASKGVKNVFGMPVHVTEMQHEGGAAGAVHGSLAAGALTSTYTASQGLLLMIPDMYKISGERLPGVFHVAARTLSTCSINMYGDHQDVMAALPTGFAQLVSSSVQEIMDIAPAAHLSAIEGRIPFIHFFDGFRTSHEVQKIEVWDYKDLGDMLNYDAVKKFKENALNPQHPKMMGTFEKSGYFQRTEAQNKAYNDLPAIVENNLKKINKKLGTSYGLFNYVGAPDATDIIIAMGSITDTITETVNYLNNHGKKVGLVKVHLFRPFSIKHFLDVIPKTVQRIAVLDRTKEKGSVGEPLFQDVVHVFAERKEKMPLIVGGRYGLGQKDTTPAMVKAVFDNLEKENPKNHFTLGIYDDVTNTSLNFDKSFVIANEGTTRCKFWGNGGDGTVGANKSAIKIIGDNTDMFAQGYFDYDAKKSNGLTTSHLRFSKHPITAAYLLDESDFVSCSPQAYVNQYDLLDGLKKGGTFLLNTIWSDEELEERLPNRLKRAVAEKEVNFYTINASKIAVEVGLGNRTNMVIQTAFFKLANVLPIDDAIRYLKDSIVKSYGKKGQNVVDMNNAAVDKSLEALHKVNVPESWKNLKDDKKTHPNEPDFIKNMVRPILELKEDVLPVSTYLPYDDGAYMAGTSQYEKRGVALFVPEWEKENCIQCNQCALVCPHASIRPFVLTNEELKKAPKGFETIKSNTKGMEDMNFRMQVSPYDCAGCGNCADICPAKNKALEMKPIQEEIDKEAENFMFAHEEIGYKENIVAPTNVKNSQFKQPLLEFSGACAGCGETPYAKLVTQLYGEHMYIANATGCSSIWGSSVPSMPYTVNRDSKKGPAWASSLFEDNAEYGMGMALANKSNRDLLESLMKRFMALNVSSPLNDLFSEWIENKQSTVETEKLYDNMIENLNNNTGNAEADEILEKILDLKDYLIKKSIWIFGGDGWAYDIGFSGVDHVLASGEDINIIVFDTEVYSNTGGQSSKATPLAAVAKFASAGKRVRKKDLGLMMTTYGYVYVAQVAMGANQGQTLKAIQEAESYDGPSLIICYAPCINQGLKMGMGKSQRREKEAVESGYWHLWRFNPQASQDGKNPFTLDSKPPTASFQEFLQGEVRYASLKRSFPEEADELYSKAEEAAKERYKSYVRMAEANYEK